MAGTTNLKALLPLGLFPLVSLGCWFNLGLEKISAQIIPDNTLGNERSRITNVNPIRELIEGGAVRGENLFHSFETFNIGEGREAYFANPTGITNILSRVTGNDISAIFGTLGIQGTANLFLINPNGIVFGPNAQLDVGGSFVASTAERVTFPGGSSFSAVNPEGAPLLTISITPGLQYGKRPPAPVVNNGMLSVGHGQSLTLTGGTVVSTGELLAPGGHVSLAAVPGNSSVQLGEKGELITWSILPGAGTAIQPNLSTVSVTELLNIAGVERANLPADIQLGTTLVSGGVDASDAENIGGTIQILGDKVGLFDTQINASGLLGGGNVLIGGNYQGQGLLPNANQTYVNQTSSIKVDALKSGDGGQAIIWANGRTDFYGDVSARGGFESGNGGFVEISGKDTLVYRGSANTSALNGNFGTLLFDPFNITIVNGVGGNNDGEIVDGRIGFPDGLPQSFTISEIALEGLGANTNVVIQSTNSITIENLEDNELRFADGPGGSITFQAGGDFSMNSTDTIRAFQRDVNISGANLTIGSITTAIPTPNVIGNAGNITLTATGNISVIGAFDATISDNNFIPVALGSFVSVGSVGNAGRISLRSLNGSISITSGAISSTSSNGNGGNIFIEAWGNITAPNLNLAMLPDIRSYSFSNGKAGIIFLNSEQGNVTVGTIDSSSSAGEGGGIKINAFGNITTGSLTSSPSDGFIPLPIVLQGDIVLTSKAGSINTTGDITIFNSGDNIRLTAANNISVESVSAGNGNITISGGSFTQNTGTISGNAIDIGSATNPIGGIVRVNDIYGSNINLVANGDVTLNDISVFGNVTVQGNTITQQPGGSILVNGDASFTSTQPETGNVVVNNQNTVTSNGCADGITTCLGDSTIGGNFNLFSTGEVGQASNQFLQVAGEIRVNNVLNLDLENINNIVPLIIQQNGNNLDITVAQVGQVNVSDVVNNVLNQIPNTPVNNLTVNSLTTGPKDFNSVYDGNAITLNGNNRFSGVLRLNTVADATTAPTGIPEIIQTAPIQVNGLASFNATATGNITLNNPGNQISNVGFLGNNVAISSVNYINLTSVLDVKNQTFNPVVAGNLSLSSGGLITQNVPLTVGGDTTITSSLANAGTVSIRNTDDVALGNSAIGGNLLIVSDGSVFQLPGAVLRVAGNDISIEAAGSVDLSNSNNTIPVVELPNGDVFITQVGLINLPARTVRGNLTVNSVANGEAFIGAFLDPAITLNNPNNVFNGSISLNTSLPGTAPISGTPGITQSGTQVVNGSATFNATTGDVTLPDAGNQFGSVAFTGRNIEIREGNSTNLLNSTATGNLALTAAGAITQNGNLTIIGTSNFTNLLPDAPITLNGTNNQFFGAIGFVTTNTGNVTLFNHRDTQLSNSTIGGNLWIDSNGTITQLGGLTVANLLTLNANGNNIVLNQENDFNSVKIPLGAARNIELTDINYLNLDTIWADGNLSVTAADQISTSALVTAGGTERGNITLNARSVFLRNGGTVATSATRDRLGGDITINATEFVELSGISPVPLWGISADTSTGTSTDAGNVTINTNRLSIRDGAAISSSVFEGSTGNGGIVTINADLVEVEGTLPNEKRPSFLGAVTAGAGEGGDVLINTRALFVRDGGVIGTTSLPNSTGQGGNLVINSQETVEVSGTSANALIPSVISADTFSSERSGDIQLNTRQLTVRDGGAISVSTLGTADGGTLSIFASDSIEIRGTSSNGLPSGFYAQSFAEGTAGSIDITTDKFVIQDGGVITVASGSMENTNSAVNANVLPPVAGLELPPGDRAIGDGGNLTVNARSLFMNNHARITAETASGEGGGIDMVFEDYLLMRQDSDIRTVAGGTGNGGNINLTAGGGILALLHEDSDIIANAFAGNGGNITAQAPIIARFRQYEGVETPESDFVASSELGLDGNIEFNTERQPQETLPSDFLDASNQIDQTCTPKGAQEREKNRFIITGRGGMPPSPNDVLQAEMIITDWVTIDPKEQEQSRERTFTPNQNRSVPMNPTQPTQPQLVEAQGWVYGPNGEVILTAEAPNVTPQRPSLVKPTCRN